MIVTTSSTRLAGAPSNLNNSKDGTSQSLADGDQVELERGEEALETHLDADEGAGPADTGTA